MHGNLMNRISEHTKTTPAYGMGATISMYSDRHAATVIEIIKPNLIVIQEDAAIRTDKNGMSESQSYRFEADPNGAMHLVKLTSKGWRIMDDYIHARGAFVMVGYRSTYHDYSF